MSPTSQGWSSFCLGSCWWSCWGWCHQSGWCSFISPILSHSSVSRVLQVLPLFLLLKEEWFKFLLFMAIRAEEDAEKSRLEDHLLQAVLVEAQMVCIGQPMFIAGDLNTCPAVIPADVACPIACHPIWPASRLFSGCLGCLQR